jgi:muramoyltetrapeptide carboxypeptidase LdcA involved in peptidoglycan recycling
MPHELIDPARVSPGDRVAVLSPSWPAPAFYPSVHEQALRRLRDDLGLDPVEYPTTRRVSSPAERGADLNAAFADDSIRAVFATIGGDDQMTVLRHLDPSLAQKDPKPFLGYSDNTNLLNWLWYHGLTGVHGGSTQVHLGPGPQVDERHLACVRAALFGGDVTLRPMERTHDVGIPWDDPRALTEGAQTQPADPWSWSGPARAVTGRTWGGNLEILQWTLAAGRWVLPNDEYAGCVLLLETSEERPSPHEVYRMMRNLGERGLLEVFAAVMWARPPVGDHDVQPTLEEGRALRESYRESVRRAVNEYNPGMVVAMDVDFGHTSPQWLLPYGGRVTVDGRKQRIIAHFDRGSGTPP